jgi:hypothetical protein
MGNEDDEIATSFTVFVCGTFSDLSQEREAVLDAIRRVKLQHDSMEGDLQIENCYRSRNRWFQESRLSRAIMRSPFPAPTVHPTCTILHPDSISFGRTFMTCSLGLGPQPSEPTGLRRATKALFDKYFSQTIGQSPGSISHAHAIGHRRAVC